MEKIFFGIDDLFANLFIALNEAGLCVDFLRYKDAREYGDLLHKEGLERYDVNILLSLSRTQTQNFLYYYSKYFEENILNGYKGVTLDKCADNYTLIQEFRGYLPLSVYLLITDEEVKHGVIDQYLNSYSEMQRTRDDRK